MKRGRLTLITNDRLDDDDSVVDPRRTTRPNDLQLLRDTKFTIPRTHAGMVHRQRLTDWLVSCVDCPLVVISAPIGFGKTTLLTDWSRLDTRQFAWASLDADDDDPVNLLTSIACALVRVLPIDPAVFNDLASPDISILGRIVPRLIASLRAIDEPVVLVLHNVHEITLPESRDALDLIVDHLPAGMQVVVSGRHRVWLANGRRRSLGEVVEFGPSDLAFDADETERLLVSVGATGDPKQVERLLQSTDGWPIGLALTTLARRRSGSESDRPEQAQPDRVVSDFIRSEVLPVLSPDTLDFLSRTAVLDVMSGSLCDAVLGSTGSGEVLESLVQDNLFVVPLDEQRQWYRCQPLIRAVLLEEGADRGTNDIAGLHRRAAEWWEATGSVEQTIRHTRAAGDTGRATQMIAERAVHAYNEGRLREVEHWLGELGDADIERNPTLAVLAGWIAALTGRVIDAARWADTVEHMDASDAAPVDAASFDVIRTMLRAFACAHGVTEMATDAETSVTLVPPWSRWRAVAVGLLAIARWLENDVVAARALFSEGIEAAEATASAVPLTRLLAHRALLSIDQNDWATAAGDVDRAKSVIAEAQLAEYGASAIVYAASARLLLHRNRVDAARTELFHAMRLRVLAAWGSPWAAVALRIEMANSHLLLADPGGARVLLREIDDALHHRPDLGVLNQRIDALRDRLATWRADIVASTLSAAELRLLPYLQTHLSLKEIGERLYISRNTVSSETSSIYRKLRVSGRSEAVARARELGLLEAGIL